MGELVLLVSSLDKLTGTAVRPRAECRCIRRRHE